MKYCLVLFIFITFKSSPCQKHNKMIFNEENFWSIIEQSKNDKDLIFRKNLIDKLLLLNDDDINAFEDILVSKMKDLYNWDAYGVLVLLAVYPTMPEHFWDFRSWVIAQGRDFYYSFLKNPDIHAKKIVQTFDEKARYLDFVDLLSVAVLAMESRYKERFTEDMMISKDKIDRSYDLDFLLGVKWDNLEQLRKRFPELSKYINELYEDKK
jgi:hypothetical protein